MEWDKIWSLNRKILDKECHRYTAISKDSKSVLEIVDTEENYFDTTETNLHPKDAN